MIIFYVVPFELCVPTKGVNRSPKNWSSKYVRIRFGFRSVIQYFLGQFLERTLATENFKTFSTLWAYGAQFSKRYCIVPISPYNSGSQRTSGMLETIYKCNEY